MALLSLSGGTNKTATRPRTEHQTVAVLGNSLALEEGTQKEDEEKEKEEADACFLNVFFKSNEVFNDFKEKYNAILKAAMIIDQFHKTAKEEN